MEERIIQELKELMKERPNQPFYSYTPGRFFGALS